MRRKNLFISVAVLLVLLSSFAFTPGRAAAAYCDAAQFVADVTIPDGTVFAPGATFTKTWRLKNVGTCSWTTDYAMVFDKGEQMGAPAVVKLTANVNPGQTVDLTVDMTAPAKTGKLTGYWRLRNASGVLFGIGSKANASFWVEINVVEPKNVVVDFVAKAGDAKWSSGAGNLTFPGTEGDAKGFVVKKDKPKRESGQENSEAGLVVGPQNVTNGYIQGEYPAFRVEKGDRFQSLVHCEYQANSCYVNFRLDYQIGTGSVKTFWAFREKYEGYYYNANLDLSSLAGQDVKFFLRVDAYGSPTGDRAVWGGSKIVRGSGGTGPTVTPSATPTGPTPTPTNTSVPGACTDKVQFIADTTIPDGTVMTPGKTFKKTWRLKNIGTCTWTTSYTLVFENGEQMSGAGSANLSSQVKPGQSADVSIDLTAPNANGTYRGNWMLANDKGTHFGLGANADKPFWVEIKVTGGPTVTPSATPTGPTPTPSNTPTPTATTAPGACTDKVKFIADVNVPDGTVMTAGKTFTKTWRIQNAGTCTWTTKYALVFESGSQMNGAGSSTLSAQVKPGQSADISIALTAPSANGTYRGNWMLANESGKHFGLGTNADKPWWVEIKVTSGTTWKIYKDTTYAFQFSYPPEGQLSGNRIDLPYAAGTNLVEKWLEVTVKENVTTCGSSLGGVTEPGPVTFNGINFVKQTGGDGGAGQFHEWVSYSTIKGGTCVTMDFVLHSTNPGAYPTPPPEYDKAAESAVFTAIMETFTWVTSGSTGTYAVILVESNDVLNIRSDAGASNPIVGSFASDATDVKLTGQSKTVSGDKWVEVDKPGGGKGWVNAFYLNPYMTQANFCADAQVTKLISDFRSAAINSNGTLFLSLVSPLHGVSVYYQSHNSAIVYTAFQAANVFTSTASIDWGPGPGGGENQVGSFKDVIQPILLDVFNNSGYATFCDTPVGGSIIWEDAAWPHRYKNLHFYSLHRPGSPGVDLDWRTWVAGVDYVAGKPSIMVLMQFQWEP